MLTISNLTVEFRGVGPVVKGISISVGRGETVGLVGESGSGKSISSLSVMGLLPSTAKMSGSISFTKTDGTIVELAVSGNAYPAA